jgi:hypothetical protein
MKKVAFFMAMAQAMAMSQDIDRIRAVGDLLARQPRRSSRHNLRSRRRNRIARQSRKINARIRKGR